MFTAWHPGTGGAKRSETERSGRFLVREDACDDRCEANRAHARLRAPGERANAQLKTWRILRKLRCCPWRAGQLAKAIHVLQTRET